MFLGYLLQLLLFELQRFFFFFEILIKVKDLADFTENCKSQPNESGSQSATGLMVINRTIFNGRSLLLLPKAQSEQFFDRKLFFIQWETVFDVTSTEVHGPPSGNHQMLWFLNLVTNSCHC